MDQRKDHFLRQIINREKNYIIRQALKIRFREGFRPDLFSTVLWQKHSHQHTVGRYILAK